MSITIERKPNNLSSNETCWLCGEEFGIALGYVYVIGDYSKLVCNECAEHPESIPQRIRHHIEYLQSGVTELERLASQTYVSEVVWQECEMSEVLCTICGKPMSQAMADLGEHRHGHCMTGGVLPANFTDPWAEVTES